MDSKVDIIDVEEYGQCIRTSDGVLYNDDMTILIKCPWRSEITSVTIPDSVVTISDSAFELCSMLKSIIIPESVNHIGKAAFRCCRSLETVTIVGPVTTIDEDTFSECKSLTAINLPKTLKHISKSAFESCSSLRYIYIPDEVLDIGDYAFKDCNYLLRIRLSNNLRHIGLGAFIYCSSLEQIAIPSSLSVLNTNLFKGCEKLSSVKIPSSVLKVEDGAFHGCVQLKTFKAPHVYSIGEKSFYQCKSLSQVSIPMVANIKDEAFMDCISLKEVSLSDVLMSIGNRSFLNCNLIKKISIPSSIRHMGIDCLPLGGHALIEIGKKSKNDKLLEDTYDSDDPDSLIVIRPLQKPVVCSICGTACFTNYMPYSSIFNNMKHVSVTLHRCPHCGYVSDHLDDGLEFDWSVLNTLEYLSYIDHSKKGVGIEGARALILSDVENHSLSFQYCIGGIENIRKRLYYSYTDGLVKDPDELGYCESLISTGLTLCDLALLELEASEIIGHEKDDFMEMIATYRRGIELFWGRRPPSWPSDC